MVGQRPFDERVDLLAVDKEIPVRTQMRMGEREAIEARLALLLQELTDFSL